MKHRDSISTVEEQRNLLWRERNAWRIIAIGLSVTLTLLGFIFVAIAYGWVTW